MMKMNFLLLAPCALIGFADAQPAQAQANERFSKGAMQKVEPAAEALNPQPLPPNEQVTDATVITKNGRNITLGEIRAQQMAFEPPTVAVLAKPFTLGTKIVRTPLPIQTAPLDTGFGVARTIASGVPRQTTEIVKLYSCDEKPPLLTRVVGKVTPRSVITLKGACFGATSGQVRMLGSIPGGFRDLTPIKWTEGEIAVQIPADLSGVADGQMSVEATTPQRKATNTKPVNFVAKREIVDVSHLWRPGCQNMFSVRGTETIDLKCGNNWVDYRRSEFTGAIRGPNEIHLKRPNFSNFTIEVNRHCYLESAWPDVRRGTVMELSGWPDGPPEKSSVTVLYQVQNFLEEHWYGDTAHSYLNYTLRANASCPVGVSPNP